MTATPEEQMVLHVRAGNRGGRDRRYKQSLASRQNNGRTLCGAAPDTADVSEPAAANFLSWPDSVRARMRYRLCPDCVAAHGRKAGEP